MRTALFESRNLIGDALYISPAWNEWYQRNGERYDRIDLLTLPDHVAVLYRGMGVPCEVIHELPENKNYDFAHVFNVNDAFRLSDQKKCHVAESYAELLLLEPLKKLPNHEHVRPIYMPPEIELHENEKGLILISAFSASCTSRQGRPPNKMLPWYKWLPVWRWLYEKFPDKRLVLLGAPTDEVPNPVMTQMRKIHPHTEYMRGIALDRLAWIMREALFIITIDNGMSHLAASQGAREFVLYPACLGAHYILPIGNAQNLNWIHMDPMSLSPATLVWALQNAKEYWKV